LNGTLSARYFAKEFLAGDLVVLWKKMPIPATGNGLNLPVSLLNRLQRGSLSWALSAMLIFHFLPRSPVRAKSINVRTAVISITSP
jgi:hypothetical protein